MKDSGIQWIGMIPSDWELRKVKSLFHIGRGRVIAVGELSDEGEYPVYSSQTKNNGILGYISTYDFDCSQLTWTTDGANAGTVFIRSGKHNCTNVCGTLLPHDDKNYLPFLKYALEYIAIYHKRADINGYKIMNNEMADIVIHIPPKNEQHRIANFLDDKCTAIDDVIAKTQESIEEYKKLKQSVITEAVAKGVRGKRPMKDSGIEWIGQIPKDWDIRPLKAHTSMITPMRDKPEKLNGPIPWIRIEDFSGKYIEQSKDGLGVSQETIKSMNLKIYPIGSILCTSSCDLGKCAIVSKQIVSNQRFINIVPDNNTSSDYLYYLMVSNSDRLNTLSTGAIQANLSRKEFEHLMVQFPIFSEQREIADYLDKKCAAIDSLIEKKQQFIEELTAYKKSLIYEYVTGKKEVPA